MNKLQSVTLYALLTPVLAFGSGSLLAQPAAGGNVERDQQGTQGAQQNTQPGQPNAQRAQPNAQREQPNAQREQQNTQRDSNAAVPATRAAPGNPNASGVRQPAAPIVAGSRSAHDQDSMKSRGFLSASPANGMEASNLIGTEVMVSGDEDVGTVDDLIIDENGRIVAIIVGVGGFLGMAEKDVAIGWDDVTRTGSADEQELRIVMTRDGLMSAPEFKRAE